MIIYHACDIRNFAEHWCAESLSVNNFTISPLHHFTISPLYHCTIAPFKVHLLASAPTYSLHCPDILWVPTTLRSVFSISFFTFHITSKNIKSLFIIVGHKLWFGGVGKGLWSFSCVVYLYGVVRSIPHIPELWCLSPF